MTVAELVKELTKYRGHIEVKFWGEENLIPVFYPIKKVDVVTISGQKAHIRLQ